MGGSRHRRSCGLRLFTKGLASRIRGGGVARTQERERARDLTAITPVCRGFAALNYALSPVEHCELRGRTVMVFEGTVLAKANVRHRFDFVQNLLVVVVIRNVPRSRIRRYV